MQTDSEMSARIVKAQIEKTTMGEICEYIREVRVVPLFSMRRLCRGGVRLCHRPLIFVALLLFLLPSSSFLHHHRSSSFSYFPPLLIATVIVVRCTRRLRRTSPSS